MSTATDQKSPQSSTAGTVVEPVRSRWSSTEHDLNTGRDFCRFPEGPACKHMGTGHSRAKGSGELRVRREE
jgi:hypothetical protein